MKDPGCLIFVHLPKTAGTTLNEILSRYYPADTIYSANVRVEEAIEAFMQLPEAERRKLRVLRGHIGFGLHTFLPQGYTYTTMLRKPVSRVTSSYYYIRRTPAHRLHAIVNDKQMSLEAFVTSGLSKSNTDNGQTRMLSGAPGRGNSIEFGQCGPELLEAAKRNLATHFSVVGLTEAFDESILLMRRMFGWPFPYYVRRNVTQGKPPDNQVSPETRAVIERQNALDVQLYQYAKGLFAEQKRRQGWIFPLEVRYFRWRNRHPNIKPQGSRV